MENDEDHPQKYIICLWKLRLPLKWGRYIIKKIISQTFGKIAIAAIKLITTELLSTHPPTKPKTYHSWKKDQTSSADTVGNMCPQKNKLVYSIQSNKLNIIVIIVH